MNLLPLDDRRQGAESSFALFEVMETLHSGGGVGVLRGSKEEVSSYMHLSDMSESVSLLTEYSRHGLLEPRKVQIVGDHGVKGHMLID